MIEQFAELFNAAEAVLLVVVGAVITGISNGLNERRKRRNELMDRRIAARQKVMEVKVERLQRMLEVRQQCLRIGISAPDRIALKVEMQGLASLLGEREIIEATAQFTGDSNSPGTEVLEVSTRRIRELEESLSLPLPGFWKKLLPLGK